MLEKDIKPLQYTCSKSTRPTHMPAPEDTLAAYSTKTSASPCQGAKCEDLVCQQQERNHQEPPMRSAQDVGKQWRARRACFLYETFDKETPSSLICYDCGIFHPRILSGKQDLPTYPVHCKASTRPETRGDFLRHRTAFSVVRICCISVPWLQVHQTARALRHGPKYGAVTLNYHRAHRNGVGMRCFWQAASKALLVDDRLLVRAQYFLPIGTVIESTPGSRLVDEGAEFMCPHARSRFLYSSQRANDVMEACRLFCRAHATASSSSSNGTLDNSETSKLHGFVHSRHRCPHCPTEWVVEILPRASFAGAHMMGRLVGRRRKYVLCLSQYLDFGACNAPNEREWRALSTWPAERPEGDWGPVGAKGDEAQVDLTGMERISVRFERALKEMGKV
ncbi:hypothetical protein C7974DRAFT_428652 [Boeremia exigua]|uniref:uncharacterized protein n=1 Tax=Boeremia exigua TaxID=749465 RepID=UPI001E8E481B|nr:uncharacterized protein C7974DRAFT_428652 [Boeremia exigua]KAH6614252.1 hypothetical protein C7974DRAFT_428652 [Boeremia exigua]